MDRAKFKKLQQTWYKKLKARGFQDIEKPDGNLKRYDGEWFRKHVDTLRYTTVSDYFTQCSQFGVNHAFSSKREQRIWQEYCKGKTLEQIEEVVALKKSQIANIINSIIKVMDERRDNNT